MMLILEVSIFCCKEAQGHVTLGKTPVNQDFVR
jgi:hypothetical protein